MENDFLKTIAKTQEESLRVVAKDMENLARMTKKTKADENPEKFQANLVQGAFYITAYSMAVKSFNKMIEEKQANPECDRGQVDYFLDVVLEMQKANMDREKKHKELKDDN